jgi:hemerythrin-like domain-containing protein
MNRGTMPTPRKLVDVLRVQHAELLRLIQRVTEAVERDSERDVSAALASLTAALLAHLAIEDERLYPALTRATNRSALDMPSKIARTYEHNMETISVALRAFLEKYSGAETLDLPSFRRDWHLVSELLVDRIASEEKTLYPLYDSWVTDA